MSSRPAQRHHFCPGAERRHHHQALAGTAGQELAGGPGDRSKGHPLTTTVAPHTAPNITSKAPAARREDARLKYGHK